MRAALPKIIGRSIVTAKSKRRNQFFFSSHNLKFINFNLQFAIYARLPQMPSLF